MRSNSLTNTHSLCALTQNSFCNFLPKIIMNPKVNIDFSVKSNNLIVRNYFSVLVRFGFCFYFVLAGCVFPYDAADCYCL